MSSRRRCARLLSLYVPSPGMRQMLFESKSKRMSVAKSSPKERSELVGVRAFKSTSRLYCTDQRKGNPG